MSRLESAGHPRAFEGVPGLAEEIVERTNTLSLDDVPPQVREATKLHILDALGVGLAASEQRPQVETALARLGAGESTVLAHGRGTLPPHAAMLNGMLMESLEFDDTDVPLVIHGGAVVVPAALAVGERERVTGAELLVSVVAGWELLVRIGLASPGGFQANGFQTVAVAGSFAAAAITALLTGVERVTFGEALGIAASQAGGTFELLSDGSPMKALHPGWAAHSGILAVELARLGMTAPRSMFEGRFGLFAGSADDGTVGERLAELIDDLGHRWLLPQAGFKLYPCCHHIHGFLECAELLRAQGLIASQVQSVRCRVPAEEAAIICEPWERKRRPPTADDARFSLPACLATVLVHGRLCNQDLLGLQSDREVLELAGRVTWCRWESSGFPARLAAEVEVTTTAGETRRVSVDDVRGTAAPPVEGEQVREKFLANALPAISRDAVDRLQRCVLSLEDEPDLTRLSTSLREHSGHDR